MATENKPKKSSNNGNNNKRKQRYRANNKPTKRGGYALRPGVQGFFLTCDGGRERQASHEAISVIESFYEELVNGKDSDIKHAVSPDKLLNKKTIFSYSDSEDDDHDDDDPKDEEDKEKSGTDSVSDANHKILTNEMSDPHGKESDCYEDQVKGNADGNKEDDTYHKNQDVEPEEQPAKKQRLDTDVSEREKVICPREDKSVDKLIEAELEELKDKSKRRFNNLDSGCNGVVFIQMHKKDGDPSPKDIVQHIVTSAASTRKHMSRFILRVLPVEVTCYASEEEISQTIKPLIARHFPLENPIGHKFAVLYEARANTGVDRAKIINAVAQSIPGPHKVDLNNPEKSIVVQIVKTVCLIGVVEKYKELSKYNLRQLTSPKQ